MYPRIDEVQYDDHVVVVVVVHHQGLHLIVQEWQISDVMELVRSLSTDDVLEVVPS